MPTGQGTRCVVLLWWAMKRPPHLVPTPSCPSQVSSRPPELGHVIFLFKTPPSLPLCLPFAVRYGPTLGHRVNDQVST